MNTKWALMSCLSAVAMVGGLLGSPLQGQEVSAHRRRRVPKAGFIFSLLRVVGIILEAGGLLISAASVAGFIILLVRIAPGLVSALNFSEQKFAGFVFILYLVWLVVPVVVGILGMLVAVIGFACHRLGTLPIANAVILKDLPGTKSSAPEG
jgi:hypothetical protein